MNSPKLHPHKPVGTTIWHCYPNFITCERNDHLWAHYKTGFRGCARDMRGAMPLMCDQCDPPQYFLAVFSNAHATSVTCYELSKDCYEELMRRPNDTFPPLPELLYLIRDPQGRSYNPYWRPPKHTR